MADSEEGLRANQEADGFESWAIVELMGHRRLAGRVTEETLFATTFLRIDVPALSGDGYVTQYYGGGSVYCLTPTTEELARRVAMRNRPTPVAPYELAPLVPGVEVEDDDEDWRE